MSTGWGRGPGGDIGTQGNINVVPEEAVSKSRSESYYPVQSNCTNPGNSAFNRETIDMSLVPSKLAKLQRSPKHKSNRHNVWTTSLSGKPNDECYNSPSGIILTDVAFNRPPDLIFDSPIRSPSSNCPPSCLVSGGLLPKKKRTKVSFSFEPRNESNIPQPLRHSLFGRILNVVCNSILCWKPQTPPIQNTTNVNQTEDQKDTELKLSIDSEATEDVSEIEEEDEDNFPVFPEESLDTEIITRPPTRRVRNDQILNNKNERLSPISTVSASVSGFENLNYSEEKYNNNKRRQQFRGSVNRKINLLPVPSLLDLCREREKTELLPGRYLDDMKVLHNIRRREIIAKFLYRESGQLFPRIGPKGEPNPPLPRNLLLSGPTPLPPIDRNFEIDPECTYEDREKVFKKIVRQKAHLESTGEEKIAPSWEHSNFVQDCLRAHNLYRARHCAPPLILSSKLCSSAQNWVNHLAQAGILKFQCDQDIGENIFCRNVALAMKSRLAQPDITGEEVAAYWYSSVRQYRFGLPDTALHAHAGSYSQMVWKGCRDFGVGKALSRCGKIIVVAHYYPPGNITNQFRANVLPLSTRALAAEMLCQGQALLEDALVDSEEDSSPLKKALMNVGTGVSGVLSAQPPNITGRNATKILAAHMLGHAASVITTSDDRLEVVIVSRKSMKKKERKKKLQESIRKEKFKEANNQILFEKIREELLNSNRRAEEQLRLHEEAHKPIGITRSLGEKRNPKLCEIKRVKFKSEENINYCDRSKGVQTSFSSENLSTEDFSASCLSSARDMVSDEALSGWTASTSSVIVSSYSESKSSSDIQFSSQASGSLTIGSNSSIRSSSDKTNNSKRVYSNNSKEASSQTFSEDTSQSHALLASSDMNAYIVHPSCSTCQSTSTSSNSLTNNNPTPPNTPLKCKLRHVKHRAESYGGSLDSINSLPSDNYSTAASANSSTDEFRSKGTPRLNLPFSSPDATSGMLNCYALSPLPY